MHCQRVVRLRKPFEVEQHGDELALARWQCAGRDFRRELEWSCSSASSSSAAATSRMIIAATVEAVAAARLADQQLRG